MSSSKNSMLLRGSSKSMAVVVSDVRVVKFKRFPYGIYYRVIGDSARVLTIKHLHRDPGYGLDRT